jgi:hypothetical protein
VFFAGDTCYTEARGDDDATIWHFRHESRATTPPVWIQNLIIPPLSGLAKILGVRAYHARWDSRTTTSESSP